MICRLSCIFWGCLLACVVGLFFFPSLFQHHSLVPTDILHQFVLPHDSGSPIDVQNHYNVDEVQQTYPAGVFWQESVRHGEMPLWNPYMFGGHPQLSTSIWGILCPAKLLYLVCSPERALTLGLILQLFLAGVFMMAFLRELGVSWWASFLGGCAYAFNGQFMMMSWLWLNVFPYVPLVLFLYERSLRRNSLAYALGAGLAMAIPLVSGSIQMTFFVGCLCGFYGFASIFWQPPGKRRPVVIRLVVMFVVAVLAGAIQFLPTTEFLLREVSGRITNSTQGRMPTVLHLLIGIPALITFIFPALAGSPEAFDVLKVFRGTMMHYTAYIGLIPFTLFVIGVQKRGDKRIMSMLILIILTLVVVFFTPLVRYVYHRFFILAVFAMAVLAAFGFELLLKKAPEDLPKIHRAFGVLSILGLLLIVGLFGVQWYLQGHYTQTLEAARGYLLKYQGHMFKDYPDWLFSRIPRFFDHYQVANPLFGVPLASLAGLLVLWVFYARQKLHRSVFAGLVICLTIADLTVFGRNLVPQVDLGKYPAYPPIPLLAKPQADPELHRIYRWMPKDPLTLVENVPTAYGLSMPTGYESLVPENLGSLPVFTNETFNALLDLENAKYLLTDGAIPLPRGRFEEVAESHGNKLFLNKSWMPRLNFVSQWEVVSERKQLLDRMLAPDFNPRETVFLEQEPVQFSDSKIVRPTATPEIHVEKYSAQKITATVANGNPGILLLSDTWYPGWKVRVDGRPAALYRADYILKGVYLTVGPHRVEFYFAPASFYIGATISLLTIAATLISALVVIFRAKVQTPKPLSPSTMTRLSQ